MWTKAFWLATLERVLRTFAQALIAALTASGTGLIDTDWQGAASTAGMAAVLALLTCVAASGVGSPGPSLGTEVAEPDTSTL